jgi:glycogenin
VQYHTKGEFQPYVPVVSISSAYQPEETESEIFHATAEQPLHETVEIPKEVEEAYVPPARTNLEAEIPPEPQPEPQPAYEPEPEVHYAPWNASMLVKPERRNTFKASY